MAVCRLLPHRQAFENVIGKTDINHVQRCLQRLGGLYRACETKDSKDLLLLTNSEVSSDFRCDV